MESILNELVEPFDRVSPDAATALLLEHWGIAATALELLDTERDDTFHVTTPQGDYVLKVAHPLDPLEQTDMQSAVMTRAFERGLPAPRVVPALDGSARVMVDARAARLLTWLDGTLLIDAGTRSPTQVAELGTTLATLAAALADLDHPGAHRRFAWDLQGFASLREAPHPPEVDPVFDAFDSLDLAALPHQVIHNDFHPGNVLVDPTGSPYVVGVLDFGDAVYGPRVQDLAVALGYLVPVSGDTGPVVEAFVAGYERVTPLLEAERLALPVLIAARLGQRVILPPLLDPDDLDPETFDRNLRTLRNLLARS